MPSSVIHTGPPTHPALHVRDATDAHVLLEAVRLNMLPLIRRRLTTNEREQLASGNVFVWEEAENDGGLLRWTDGRRWSQSRMRGDYLFYEEKMEATPEEKEAKAALRARRAADPLAAMPPTNRRKDRPNRPNGLTKQTYSALVYLPGLSHPRKWHVVAYFTADDYQRLPVIDSYDYLRNLRVPEGIFVSSKANAVRNDRYPMADPRETRALSHDPSQLDLPAHSSQNHGRSFDAPSASASPISPSLSTLFSPSLYDQHHYSRPYNPHVSLPSLSTLTGRPQAQPHSYSHSHSHLYPEHSHSSSAHPVRLNHPSPSNYSPLTAEDRRVLNSFRVVL